MKLDSQTVHDTLSKIIAAPGDLTPPQIKAAKEGNPPAGYHIVQGVMLSVLVNDAKAKKQKETIRELLAELPDPFHEDKGGGWSFLQACMDRHGRQWGEHPDIDSLICIGQAVGLLRMQFTRDMWKSLPGGMPYLVVTKDS